MKKYVLSLSILFLIVSSSKATDTLQQVASWKAVLQNAKATNKLIFVDCYFTGCHPCAQMDKEVFPNEMVKAELNKNFVAIKVDVFKEKLGDTLNMKYGLSGFPTFLILNSQGQLLSMFSGYKDPGLLLGELNTAKELNLKKNSLSGFAVENTVIYQSFYKDYYNREQRKADPITANTWIKQQKDWTAEPVAMAIFKTRQLDGSVEEYLLSNFDIYLKKYGESLVLGKANDILSVRLDKAIGKTRDEKGFRDFLSANAKLFPKEEWRVLNFLLGYKYYGSIAKDTMALLQFINEDPLVYANYMGALYNNMIVKKQVNETTMPLLCSWASRAVNEESAFDMIRTAASMCKQNKDMDGFRRFVTMAISKAKKYKVPSEGYEKMLTLN